jgi:hypothetical protein
MAAKRSELTVLTANRLGDGRVVYLAKDDEWTTRLDAALLVRSDDEAERAELAGARAEAERVVVEPYLIDVEFIEDGVRPARLRERIRAEGPTTGSSLDQPDFAKAS